MAITLSTGVVNAIASGMGWGDVIKNSIIKVYSGTQPTSANDAATGTLLCQFSTGTDGAYTAEVPAAAKIAFSGSDANVTALTIGGTSIISSTVTAVGTIAGTVAALAANINSTFSFPDYYAVIGGSVVGGITYVGSSTDLWIISPKNSGSSLNGLTVSITTTITTAINGGSSTGIGQTGGVIGVPASACLSMTYPAIAGVISKSGTWQDTSANATGSASYFRILCTPYYDDGTTSLSTTNDNYKIMRIDGNVGTSGADMLISNTAITAGASQTCNQFDLTVA